MDIATLANIFVPLSAAVTSFVIVTLHLYYRNQGSRARSVKVLWFYFGCCIVNWSAIFLYFYLPNVFVVLNSFVFFTFIIVQILFYNFLFFLTRIDADERFPQIHFLIPILISLFLTALMLLTPFQAQRLSVLGRGEFTGGSYLFFIVSNSKMPVRLVFSVVYTGLCFIRLYRYRKRVENYSANYDKSSLHWVKTYLILSVSLIPIPLMGIILPRGEAAASVFLSIQNLLILFQYAFLCFHLVTQNYIYLDDSLPKRSSDKELEESNPVVDFTPGTFACETECVGAKVKITRVDFEEYIASERPYLNSDLRLTDVAADLNTNRTYLSAFINTEYGVNFNGLINRYRLLELERLKELEGAKGWEEKEMVERVGFGSYRNYKRFVSQKD
ncbi:MAG: hypothetical protein JW783_12185 [Bacteroidales bacterium]|nr:hypothetical protein [Bacteroidales bacterium]MBN2748859.1 hypothetical protein [Bacteroidales bacterium]